MSNEIELSERKRELLLSAVEDYIETALPITSEKVHKSAFVNLSSATLRNELSTLEEMGFLKQLHTSSGRIPTTKAYRYFVNNIILNNNFLNKEKLDQVKDKFLNRSAFLGDMLNNIAKGISEITEHPTVVRITGFHELEVTGVNIIKLLTGQALVLFQTSAGIIDSTIQLPNNATEENCKDASKFLTTNLYGKKVKYIINNIETYNQLFKNQIKFYQELFEVLTGILKQYADVGTSMVKNPGATKLLSKPEYKDVNSAKKFLQLIESEQEIKTIIENIDDNRDNDIVFTIGTENENENLSDYSIVAANYKLNSGIVATVGVVGPQRLDYAKIASALKYINDEIKKEKG